LESLRPASVVVFARISDRLTEGRRRRRYIAYPDANRSKVKVKRKFARLTGLESRENIYGRETRPIKFLYA